MAAPTRNLRSQTTEVPKPAVIYFTTPDGDPGFATRFGRRYLGRDRWRGWELCGIQNKRAGAALVAGDDRIRVRIIT